MAWHDPPSRPPRTRASAPCSRTGSIVLISFLLNWQTMLTCWAGYSHRGSMFAQLLLDLDGLARSAFTATPHESFRTMQQDWKYSTNIIPIELADDADVLGWVLAPWFDVRPAAARPRWPGTIRLHGHPARELPHHAAGLEV